MWKRTDNEDEDAYLEGRPMSPVPSVKASEQTPTGGSATIGPSITIKGDISGDEDLVIRGNVKGSVNLAKNNVLVGKDGHLKADIKAKIITVEGEVVGNLSANEQIVIKRSGSVDGNISAPRLVLEDGCRFKGAVEMGDSDSKSKPESASVKSKVTGLGSSRDDNKSGVDKNFGKKINDSL